MSPIYEPDRTYRLPRRQILFRLTLLVSTISLVMLAVVLTA